MRISRQPSVMILYIYIYIYLFIYLFIDTHTYWHCKMLHFCDLISLPVLICNYYFTDCLWITSLIALPVPHLLLSFHCLFLINISRFTVCSWSTVITSLPLPDVWFSLYYLLPNYSSSFSAGSWSTIFISLPVPDIKFPFHCLLLIYTYRFILPVPELHFPLHYLFLIIIIISLTVPDLQFSFPLPLSHIQISFHCLFPIHAWLILDRRNSDEWPISYKKYEQLNCYIW